jgi:RNA polymerase sigma factor (sigma-70 family)
LRPLRGKERSTSCPRIASDIVTAESPLTRRLGVAAGRVVYPCSCGLISCRFMEGPPGGCEKREDATTLSLVRAAQSGDRAAVEALFARYLPRVRQIVALRLGYGWRRFAAYDDLVQDALLRLFSKLDSFEERPEGTFRNWVAVCVANSVRNSLRGERSKGPGGARIVPIHAKEDEDSALRILDDQPGPSTLHRGKEMFDRIEKVLLEMKEEHREPILLRKFCEMSYEEVASALGLPSEAAARKAVSRAVAVLRERLGD